MTGIKTNIIDWTIRHPRLTNAVSGTLQQMTFGLWQRGLYRTARVLSQNLQPGTKLQIEKGKAYGLSDGGRIQVDFNSGGVADELAREVLGNISFTVDQEHYSEDLTTLSGLTRFLRWNVVSNAPRAYRLLPAIAGDFLLGSAGTSLGALVYFGWGFSSLAAMAIVLGSSLFWLPWHRLHEAVTPKKLRDSVSRLSQVETLPFKEFQKILGRYQASYGFVSPLLPGYYFHGLRLAEGRVTMHERAHIGGASEGTAEKIAVEEKVKHWFYAVRRARNLSDKLFFALGLALGTARTNLYPIDMLDDPSYFLQYMNMRFQGTFSHLSTFALYPETIPAYIEEHRAQLEDWELAQLHMLRNDKVKALPHYQALINDDWKDPIVFLALGLCQIEAEELLGAQETLLTGRDKIGCGDGFGSSLLYRAFSQELALIESQLRA